MITFADKQTGDNLLASEVNEIKSVVNSLFKAYLNFFDISSASITTISELNAWVKLATATTEGISYDGLSHTNNRVTASSAMTIKMEGICSVSSGNNNEIHVAFFKNGSIVPCSEQSVVTSGAGKSGAVPFQCLVELSANDYVEVFVKNSTSATNVTLSKLNVIITEL